MIRVAFVIEGQSWLGGINYFRNLFSALNLLADRKLHLLLFVGTRAPENMLKNFSQVEIVRTRLLDEKTFAARLRRLTNRFSGHRDPLMGMLLARHNIDVLSHLGPLWGVDIKTIGWIPDFQHAHLPAFFNEWERTWRNAAFRRIASRCDRVLLSSQAAQQDLAAFAPAALSKSRVLRFVPEVDAADGIMPIGALQEKYGFTAPYFYIPNQFWIHKNHKVAIDALADLKARDVNVTVLATGSTEDYRHPDHYNDLMARLKRDGLAESFKVLGLVPYRDLLSLMHHSLAVINPSLFEGWSSTVEEAKALDKTILLSNLPAHIEQNPAKGIFFDPANASELADKMLVAMREAHPPVGGDLTYSDSYKANRLRFAHQYQEIVMELVESGG